LLCPSAQSPHSKPIVTTTIRGAARKRRCRLAPETRGRCPCHTTTPLRHPADHATTVDTRSTTGARKVGLDTVSSNVARGCCLRGSRGGPRAASLADLVRPFEIAWRQCHTGHWPGTTHEGVYGYESCNDGGYLDRFGVSKRLCVRRGL
jgi:hypothetical protein